MGEKINILFVLSQRELTGAETYVASLIKVFKNKGYKLSIVSDTLTTKMDIPYYSLSLDNRKSFIERIKHIRALCKIIKKENINILHAHSRASSWVAYFASKIAHIPLITTAHCIYPIHLSNRLIPCFGEKIIAVCGAVREHLIRDFKLKREDVFLIPNGIDLHYFKPQAEFELKEELSIQEEKVVSWIGRLSGPKGRLIEDMVDKVFPEVLKAIPNLKILIVAGGDCKASLENKIKAIEKITFMGYRENIPQICEASDLVIGSGRVALEAMACAKPVIAIGENKLLGLISPKTIEEGMYTNFGDCCPQEPINWEMLVQSLIGLLKDKKERNKLGQWGRKIIQAQFDVEKIADEVEKVYKMVCKL